MPAQALLTAEELLRLKMPNKRTELVRGTLIIREPAGYQHGDVVARLLLAIGTYVEANALGRVFAAQTGFTLSKKPDTARARTSHSSAKIACLTHRRADSPRWHRI